MPLTRGSQLFLSPVRRSARLGKAAAAGGSSDRAIAQVLASASLPFTVNTAIAPAAAATPSQSQGAPLSPIPEQLSDQQRIELKQEVKQQQQQKVEFDFDFGGRWAQSPEESAWPASPSRTGFCWSVTLEPEAQSDSNAKPISTAAPASTPLKPAEDVVVEQSAAVPQDVSVVAESPVRATPRRRKAAARTPSAVTRRTPKSKSVATSLAAAAAAEEGEEQEEEQEREQEQPSSTGTPLRRSARLQSRQATPAKRR